MEHSSDLTKSTVALFGTLIAALQAHCQCSSLLNKTFRWPKTPTACRTWHRDSCNRNGGLDRRCGRELVI